MEAVAEEEDVTSLLEGEGVLYWLMVVSPSTPFTACTNLRRCGKTRTRYPLYSIAPLAVLSCLMILHFTLHAVNASQRTPSVSCIVNHCLYDLLSSPTLKLFAQYYPPSSLYCPSYSPNSCALSLYKLDSDSVHHNDSVGLYPSD